MTYFSSPEHTWTTWLSSAPHGKVTSFTSPVYLSGWLNLVAHEAQQVHLGCSNLCFPGSHCRQRTSQSHGSKVSTIQNFCRPHTKLDISSFLGMIGHYNFSQHWENYLVQPRKHHPHQLSGLQQWRQSSAISNNHCVTYLPLFSKHTQKFSACKQMPKQKGWRQSVQWSRRRRS